MDVMRNNVSEDSFISCNGCPHVSSFAYNKHSENNLFDIHVLVKMFLNHPNSKCLGP